MAGYHDLASLAYKSQSQRWKESKEQSSYWGWKANKTGRRGWRGLGRSSGLGSKSRVSVYNAKDGSIIGNDEGQGVGRDVSRRSTGRHLRPGRIMGHPKVLRPSCWEDCSGYEGMTCSLGGHPSWEGAEQWPFDIQKKEKMCYSLFSFVGLFLWGRKKHYGIDRRLVSK